MPTMSGPVGSATTGSAEAAPPEPIERYVGAFAIAAFVVCSLLGPLAVLWWARKDRSPFARRWAIVSLVLDLCVVALNVVLTPVLVFASDTVASLVFLGAFVIHLALWVYALVLAVFAWTGRGIAESPVPDALVVRLR
jgi:hypothetical protein